MLTTVNTAPDCGFRASVLRRPKSRKIMTCMAPTLEEILDETGWPPHKVPTAFAGALKMTPGLEVTSEKVAGGGVLVERCDRFEPNPPRD